MTPLTWLWLRRWIARSSPAMPASVGSPACAADYAIAGLMTFASNAEAAPTAEGRNNCALTQNSEKSCNYVSFRVCSNMAIMIQPI